MDLERTPPVAGRAGARADSRDAIEGDDGAPGAPERAVPRVQAARVSESDGPESNAPAAAAAKATAAVPAEVARSIDLSALGSTLARALRRLVTALEDEGPPLPHKGGVGDRQPLTGAAVEIAGASVVPNAAPLTLSAVSQPGAVARSASVADALASLHIDDRGVAVIRVEHTALGAIEAQVARHGADISIRLRAVDSEHQARLLHALPAVRRELDSSELFVGRVDVRGDVPTDSFGRGASNRSPTDDTSRHAAPDVAEPERAASRVPPAMRPGRATHSSQPGERRRLIVIA